MSTDAVSQPYAVVIMSGDARIADTAVLASRWLEKVAGATLMSWMKENSIIWIMPHFTVEILLGDERLRYDASIQAQIW
jgi:S-adenosylhomocysteine hydrolase